METLNKGKRGEDLQEHRYGLSFYSLCVLMVQFKVFVFTSKLFFKYESLENEKILNNWFSLLRVLFEVTDQVLVGEQWQRLSQS